MWVGLRVVIADEVSVLRPPLTIICYTNTFLRYNLINLNPNSILFLVYSAGFFLLIFVSGFLTKRSSKPYPVIILNIHKLIALGTLVYLTIIIVRMDNAIPLTQAQLTVGILSAALFALTIITGGLSSIDKPMPDILLKLHRVAPYLTVLSTAAALYLILSARA